jgi:hypothetical protein
MRNGGREKGVCSGMLPFVWKGTHSPFKQGVWEVMGCN